MFYWLKGSLDFQNMGKAIASMVQWFSIPMIFPLVSIQARSMLLSQIDISYDNLLVSVLRL